MFHDGKYVLAVRVEGNDRKSFFAIAESPNGIDNFRFRKYPVRMPETGDPDTNVYDMRLTAHEDGWIYGIFCTERKDLTAPGDLSAAVAAAGIARMESMTEAERKALIEKISFGVRPRWPLEMLPKAALPERLTV